MRLVGPATNRYGLSGSANGAVKAWAYTVAGSEPTPRKPRIIETAWYRCVEETCTEVTWPISPSRTRPAERRAAA